MSLSQKLLHIELLKGAKNLLGFSGGVDSSALFFLLREVGVSADIAIVNYQTREESNLEEAHAHELARRFGVRCFSKRVKLEESNFEQAARDVRYGFFYELMEREGYENLLLAHQLNDRLEWLLMRLSRGGGLASLLGFNSLEVRGFKNIARPLSNIAKSELYDYLHEREIFYFEDSSNKNPRFLRNHFRPLASEILSENSAGVLRSFELLLDEKARLYSDEYKRTHELFYFFASDFGARDLHKIDRALKELGYVMSGAQRDEIAKSGFSVVLGGRFAVDILDGVIFVAPFVKYALDKKTRERLRRARIAPKVRAYCVSAGIFEIENLI